MSEKTLDVKIGEAWKAHYGGQQEAAIEQFTQIVADAPDNIDAQWGLGLCYRTIGEKDQALQAFEKARTLVDAELDGETDDRERMVMLQRMVKQQIEQIDDFI